MRTWGLHADGLNAPFGARCFLTASLFGFHRAETGSLNAPFGARCFLTTVRTDYGAVLTVVLMHRLVLGAF